MKCCFYKKDCGEFENNARPVMNGRCCNDCDNGIVIPIRILQAVQSPILQLNGFQKEMRERFAPKKIEEKEIKRKRGRPRKVK